MNAVLNFLRTEPARVVALVLAVIGVASAFGLGITDGQRAAVVALVGAVLAIVGGETVRAQVTPSAAPAYPDRPNGDPPVSGNAPDDPS